MISSQDHTRRSLSRWKARKNSRCCVSRECQQHHQDSVEESEREEEEDKVMNAILANEQREMDAAEVDVTW